MRPFIKPTPEQALDNLKNSPERQIFEQDRAHQESREDTAIRRAVADAAAAGLHPAALSGLGHAASEGAGQFSQEEESNLIEVLKSLIPFALLFVRMKTGGII
jgi:hypothetical protein